MDLSMLRRLCPALCLTLVLAGCSGNHYTVFRKVPIEGSKSVVSMDAKQRTVVFNNDKSCVEASPDVFAVIAQSLSTGGTFSKSANPASVSAALNVAFGSAEQGSTIPRTQTVNMLRELMYRTCERSMNGDVSSLEMPIQAVRDQRLMVSVLAIEQLTGAVTAKPVSIGASGGASQSNGEAIVRLDDARKELDASTAAVNKAQKDYSGLNIKDEGNPEDQTCDDIAKAVKDGKDVTAEDKKKQDCTAASTMLADAKARQARATTHEADLRRMVTSLGGSVTSATSVSAPGGIDQAGTGDVGEVARTVAEIVGRNFSDSSEFLLFCMKAVDPSLADAEKARAQAFRSDCTAFLQATFIAKTQEKTTLAANSKLEEAQATEQVLAKNNEVFARYWPSFQPQLANAAKRQALASALKNKVDTTEKEKVDCVADADTREKANACFLALPNSVRQKLVTGE